MTSMTIVKPIFKGYRLFIIMALALSTIHCCKGQKERSEIDETLDIENFVHEQLEKHKIPSIAVGVVKDGKVVFSKSFGHANVAHKVLANENTVYQLGSVTKLYTGHLLAKLIEQERIELTDTLGKFFPKQVKFPKSPTGQVVTIKDIATHSSEFPRYPINLERVDPHPIRGYSKDDMYRGINAVSIDTIIGTRYNYSNFGYGVLGTAMENVMRKRLSELMTEHIFSEYDMHSTSLVLMDQIQTHLATPYLEVSPYKETEPWNMESLAAAGNLFSSIKDVNTFMLQLMKVNAVNNIQQTAYFKINDTWSYGLGCFIVNSEKRSTKVIYHGGDIDGYASSLSVYPEHQLGIAILTNWGEGQVIGQVFDGIYDIVLDDYLGKVARD